MHAPFVELDVRYLFFFAQVVFHLTRCGDSQMSSRNAFARPSKKVEKVKEGEEAEKDRPAPHAASNDCCPGATVAAKSHEPQLSSWRHTRERK